MSSSFRYALLAMIAAAGGGFLAVATYAFSTSTAMTLSFAVSIAIAAVGAAMAYEGQKRPNIVFRGLGGLLTALAAWTVFATTGVFGDSTGHWLGFAGGLGYVGIAAAGLIAGELTTERVVHHLRVGERTEAETRAEEAAAA